MYDVTLLYYTIPKWRVQGDTNQCRGHTCSQGPSLETSVDIMPNDRNLGLLIYWLASASGSITASSTAPDVTTVYVIGFWNKRLDSPNESNSQTLHICTSRFLMTCIIKYREYFGFHYGPQKKITTITKLLPWKRNNYTSTLWHQRWPETIVGQHVYSPI